MNRRFLLLILCSAFVCAADPPAESILDRYIEVTGGKKAYEQRKSEIAHGTLEYTAVGIKGSITRYVTESGKYYASLDIEGLGKMEMGVADGVAWENSAVLGPRIKTGEEKEEAVREAMLDATLNWRVLYPKVEMAGIETVDGEDCYKVVMTPKEGKPLTTFYSKKTGLEVKTTTVSVTQLGEIPVEVLASDYKKFGGILEPSKITQKAAGQDFTITITSIEVNPEIPASRFELPSDVQALAAKSAQSK